MKKTFRNKTKNGNTKVVTYKPFNKSNSKTKVSTKTTTIGYKPKFGDNKGKKMKLVIEVTKRLVKR